MTAFIKKCYKRSDISMLELTPDFIKEYEIDLSTDAGLHNGSVWSHCMWLKTIVSKAHYNGLTPRNPSAQYRVNQNIKERQYLTEDEIKAVMTQEFADKKLAYIRESTCLYHWVVITQLAITKHDSCKFTGTLYLLFLQEILYFVSVKQKIIELPIKNRKTFLTFVTR